MSPPKMRSLEKLLVRASACGMGILMFLWKRSLSLHTDQWQDPESSPKTTSSRLNTGPSVHTLCFSATPSFEIVVTQDKQTP